MRRREFLKLAATTSAGAVLFTGCGVGDGDPEREFDIQSPVNNPEDVAFGRDAWYATAQPVSAGGSNLIVRIYEGRAKKVEGNPDSPLNRGRSSALDQSLVQEVYHPDRIASPMRRRGDRGSGDYETIASWDDALNQLTTAVTDARGQTGSIVLVTEPVSGSLARVVTAFADAVGARHMVFEPDEYVVLREAMRQVFGTDRLPAIDLANSRFVLSFSAEFLHNWIAPVQLGIGYGEFRHGPDRPRGVYYHVGPQLSATASNADRWFPIVPGAEGLVALAMAQAMVDEGLVDAGRASVIYGNLDQFTPENVAPATGLSADQIRELARSFGGEQPAVAIAGTSAAAHTNGLFNVAAVFALNYLVGSVGVPGGLMLNPGSPDEANLPSVIGGAPYRDWEALASDMTNGAVQVLLVHGANPVYGLPAASGFEGALGNVPTIVSFSSFMDETTAQADLILPDHTTLESWGLHVPDPGPGFPLISLQQPVVNPFVNSRAFGDVLISVASQLGESLPWGSYEEAVRGLADGLRRGRGNIDANDPKEFFVTMQTQGGWWDETATPASAPSSPSGTISPADPQFAGDPNDFPFYLLPFPTNALDYGQFAHLPWLQGLPEPISTNVWSTWVEVNPVTGNDLGVATGDVVLVETPNGSFEVPVYINPAAARDVLLIPMGQGHRFYTRYAEQRGASPFEILAPQTDSATGALAWAATRVRISTVGRKVRIPRFEGSVPAYQLEEFPIIQVTGPSGA